MANRKIAIAAMASVLAGMIIAPVAIAQDRPIIDVHVHYSHDAWEIYPPAEAIALLRKAGLKRVFVSSSSDDGTQMLFKEAPDLIIPVLRPYSRRGETGTWMHNPKSLENVKARLARNKYAGIGEFHAFGDDVKTDVVRGVIDLARQYDLFLHAHSDAAAVRLIFEQYPEARVLWAHSGFDSPDEVRKMLETYDTLWADLAFRSDQASKDGVVPEWRELFEAFPDRIMVGTDTFTPERWPYVVTHAEWTRAWLDSLPKDLADNIAWRNAERLANWKTQ